MILEAFIAGTVGGILWLDRFQAFQVMVSRPMIAAPLVSIILGDAGAGLATGILFELLWLRRPPVGGFISPDVTLASICTATVASSFHVKEYANLFPMVLLSFAFVFPLSLLGKKMDIILRKYLGNIARAAEDNLTAKDPALGKYFISALTAGFIMAFCFIFLVTLISGYALQAILPFTSQSIMKAATGAFFLVPLVACADLMVDVRDVHHILIFLLGFVLAFLTAFFTRIAY
jgi:mannose PTS system EIIC component